MSENTYAFEREEHRDAVEQDDFDYDGGQDDLEDWYDNEDWYDEDDADY